MLFAYDRTRITMSNGKSPNGFPVQNTFPEGATILINASNHEEKMRCAATYKFHCDV